MKKLFAILLVVALLASMTTIVSAASTTTLTTTVPAATYTLNIPADQDIPFGNVYTNIGEVKVTNSNGFAEGKNLAVSLSYTDFTCDGVTTKIPFTMWISQYSDTNDTGKILTDEKVLSGESVVFMGKTDGTVSEYVKNVSGNKRTHAWVKIDSQDWGKALAGEYTATITFTAEVVAE